MASTFSVVVPAGVFRDYPEVSRVVAYMLENYCEEGVVSALDADDVRITGTVFPGQKPRVFQFIRFLNELGYNKPTFVNVRSQQEYEERLSGHAVSVAVRIVPEVSHLLSRTDGTQSPLGEAPPTPDESDSVPSQ